MTPEKRLKALGLTLHSPGVAANYLPFVRTGNLLVISGQLALGPDGKISEAHKGKVGIDVFNEAGQEAARICAINVLAQARLALGSLDRVKRCVRLGGFIAAAPDFIALAALMNGASDLMIAVFGDNGRHARTTVGVACLPLDSAVEVEAMFEVD